ncbi:unnamed protein product [Chilo suppressalis]|uniref:lysozyme n=1 Tax=Chilo suppressalis TaxID=168631 RepID=A0ABN8L7I4_CHISP|nr:hypothetical protein evm_009901 [Chilo suppressalis]CAH2983981.1 unnamed protein product [Chilo suppressalis]
MASAVIKFSAIFMLICLCAADVSELPGVKKLGAAPVTEVCLGCICQAVSGCKQGTQCEGDHCGLFHITWPYWADAGKPTINGLSPEDPQAYPSCTNDPYCAALAVQGYMAKYGQDCNGDGQINCYDYMAIHKKGGYGCAGDLPFDYVNKFNQCVAAVAAHQG